MRAQAALHILSALLPPSPSSALPSITDGMCRVRHSPPTFPLGRACTDCAGVSHRQAEGLNEILVPMITWDLDGYCLNPDSTEVRESLRAIVKYSVFQVRPVSSRGTGGCAPRA